MSDLPREALLFDGGFVVLTDTHVRVVRRKDVAESLLLKHLSSVDTEVAHSFRHRILGFLVATLLLGASLAVVVRAIALGDMGVFTIVRGRVGVGLLCMVFFGLLFLWGVVTSRRVWWITVRYGGTRKLIPLPGVDDGALERFLQILKREIDCTR
jgi:hypothetical protein